jgi:hypothetical protein
MLVGFVLGALTVVLAGGDLRRLGTLEFRGVPVLLAALLVQVVIISIIPAGNEGLKQAAHIGSYVIVFAFIAANIRIPGVWLLAMGALLNFIPIAANDGVMPADPGAVRRAGMGREEGTFQNSREVEEPRFAVLGDRFAIPESWPASNVFSIGDVLIVLGATLGMHQVCRSRLVVKRNPSVRRNAEPPSS